MDWHLAEVDLTSDPEAPLSRFWEGVTAIERADALQTFGYDDFATTDNESRVQNLQDGREQQHAVILALRGPAPHDVGRRLVAARGDLAVRPEDVSGVLTLDAPLLDNQHMGYLDLVVRPESRRHGIGGALLEEGEQILSGWDRTTILFWSTVTTAVSEGAEDAVVDPAGTVWLRTDDAGVRFALEHGFAFSQAERHSVQPLPVPQDVLAEALREAETKAAGYELVQFIGQPPSDLVDGLAPLFAGMSTDPPLGTVDWRPEVWEGERVVRAYEQMARGKRLYTTIARATRTGEIVAFTQLKGPYDKPEVVLQENTLVLGGHRGHALGLWVKAANCALVSRDRPTSRQVHTWNADENDYMLSINTRLGYRPESMGAAWQKKLA